MSNPFPFFHLHSTAYSLSEPADLTSAQLALAWIVHPDYDEKIHKRQISNVFRARREKGRADIGVKPIGTQARDAEDKYHGFELIDLDFKIPDDLEELNSAQLAALPFHSAFKQDLHGWKAEKIFYSRRERDLQNVISIGAPPKPAAPTPAVSPARTPPPQFATLPLSPPRTVEELESALSNTHLPTPINAKQRALNVWHQKANDSEARSPSDSPRLKSPIAPDPPSPSPASRESQSVGKPSSFTASAAPKPRKAVVTTVRKTLIKQEPKTLDHPLRRSSLPSSTVIAPKPPNQSLTRLLTNSAAQSRRAQPEASTSTSALASSTPPPPVVTPALSTSPTTSSAPLSSTDTLATNGPSKKKGGKGSRTLAGLSSAIHDGPPKPSGRKTWTSILARPPTPEPDSHSSSDSEEVIIEIRGKRQVKAKDVDVRNTESIGKGKGKEHETEEEEKPAVKKARVRSRKIRIAVSDGGESEEEHLSGTATPVPSRISSLETPRFPRQAPVGPWTLFLMRLGATWQEAQASKAKEEIDELDQDGDEIMTTSDLPAQLLESAANTSDQPPPIVVPHEEHLPSDAQTGNGSSILELDAGADVDGEPLEPAETFAFEVENEKAATVNHADASSRSESIPMDWIPSPSSPLDPIFIPGLLASETQRVNVSSTHASPHVLSPIKAAAPVQPLLIGGDRGMWAHATVDEKPVIKEEPVDDEQVAFADDDEMGVMDVAEAFLNNLGLSISPQNTPQSAQDATFAPCLQPEVSDSSPFPFQEPVSLSTRPANAGYERLARNAADLDQRIAPRSASPSVPPPLPLPPPQPVAMTPHHVQAAMRAASPATSGSSRHTRTASTASPHRDNSPEQSRALPSRFGPVDSGWSSRGQRRHASPASERPPPDDLIPAHLTANWHTLHIIGFPADARPSDVLDVVGPDHLPRPVAVSIRPYAEDTCLVFAAFAREKDAMTAIAGLDTATFNRGRSKLKVRMSRMSASNKASLWHWGMASSAWIESVTGRRPLPAQSVGLIGRQLSNPPRAPSPSILPLPRTAFNARLPLELERALYCILVANLPENIDIDTAFDYFPRLVVGCQLAPLQREHGRLLSEPGAVWLAFDSKLDLQETTKNYIARKIFPGSHRNMWYEKKGDVLPSWQWQHMTRPWKDRHAREWEATKRSFADNSPHLGRSRSRSPPRTSHSPELMRSTRNYSAPSLEPLAQPPPISQEALEELLAAITPTTPTSAASYHDHEAYDPTEATSLSALLSLPARSPPHVPAKRVWAEEGQDRESRVHESTTGEPCRQR